jgi:hypothetical protein
MNLLNFHLFLIFICLIRYCNRINNKTIIGFGLRRVSRIIQTSINVICLSLRQITLTPVGKFCIPAQPHPIIVHYCALSSYCELFSIILKVTSVMLIQCMSLGNTVATPMNTCSLTIAFLLQATINCIPLNILVRRSCSNYYVTVNLRI